jgi:hypothetical protein
VTAPSAGEALRKALAVIIPHESHRCSLCDSNLPGWLLHAEYASLLLDGYSVEEVTEAERG